MARPPRWQSTLDAGVEEACLAVRMYNDPAEARAFKGFVGITYVTLLEVFNRVTYANLVTLVALGDALGLNLEAEFVDPDAAPTGGDGSATCTCPTGDASR